MLKMEDDPTICLKTHSIVTNCQPVEMHFPGSDVIQIAILLGTNVLPARVGFGHSDGSLLAQKSADASTGTISKSIRSSHWLAQVRSRSGFAASMI